MRIGHIQGYCESIVREYTSASEGSLLVWAHNVSPNNWPIAGHFGIIIMSSLFLGREALDCDFWPSIFQSRGERGRERERVIVSAIYIDEHQILDTIDTLRETAQITVQVRLQVHMVSVSRSI